VRSIQSKSRNEEKRRMRGEFRLAVRVSHG
jgi:hypothetical protein